MACYIIIAVRGERKTYAGVAQPVEQLICNQQVGGSSPSTSSKLSRMPEKSGIRPFFMLS